MRLTPRLSVPALVRVSVAALALAGGLLGALAIEPLGPTLFDSFDSFAIGDPRPPASAQLVPVIVATALITTLLLALALAFGLRHTGRVRVRTVLACLILGWVNAPLVLVVGLLPEGLERSMEGAVLGMMCAGVVIGAPLGLLYGVVATAAAERLRKVLDRPTLASHTVAQRTVGATVMAGSVVGLIIVATGLAPFTSWTAPLLLLIGGALFGDAWFRARRLRRIAADDPAYQRIAASDLGIDPASLLPLDDNVPEDAEMVLVHVTASEQGAYRAGETRVPIALVE